MKFQYVAAAAVLATGSGVALADGSFAGTHFSVSFASASQGLLGDPTLLLNDVLRWRPPSFSTTSDDTGLTSSAEVTITADPGFDLRGFTLMESGLYQGGRIDVGGIFSVTASGVATVMRLVPAASTVNAAFTTGPLNAPSFDGPLGYDLGDLPWSTVVGINLLPGTTMVKFSFTNSLFAFVNDTNLAYSQIIKQTVDLQIESASAVPEPETYALMFAGLGVVGFLGRRRNQH